MMPGAKAYLDYIKFNTDDAWVKFKNILHHVYKRSENLQRMYNFLVLSKN